MANKKLSIFVIVSILANLLLLNQIMNSTHTNHNDNESSNINTAVVKSTHMTVDQTRLSPLVDAFLKRDLVFIVGAMSSGTTLMRYILDVHPQVNCGDETKIIHLLFEYMKNTLKDNFYVNFMRNSGVKNETLYKATGLFVYYMMENNWKRHDVPLSDEVRYLCNKEPMNTYHIRFIHDIYPRSKFVYMIRDGRDMAYSLMSRNSDPLYFGKFLDLLVYWNEKNRLAYADCKRVGDAYCKMVKYEDLVNSPEKVVPQVAAFLNLPWTDDMLHHEHFLGKSISLSSDPIFTALQKNKINNRSIGKWRLKINGYDENIVRNRIHMLREFNYI